MCNLLRPGKLDSFSLNAFEARNQILSYSYTAVISHKVYFGVSRKDIDYDYFFSFYLAYMLHFTFQ